MLRRLCGPGIQRLQQARCPHGFVPLCLGISLLGTFLTAESFSSFTAPVLHPRTKDARGPRALSQRLALVR